MNRSGGNSDKSVFFEAPQVVGYGFQRRFVSVGFLFDNPVLDWRVFFGKSENCFQIERSRPQVGTFVFARQFILYMERLKVVGVPA